MVIIVVSYYFLHLNSQANLFHITLKSPLNSLPIVYIYDNRGLHPVIDFNPDAMRNIDELGVHNIVSDFAI